MQGFTVTFGIQPGYVGNPELAPDDNVIQIVGAAWRDAVEVTRVEIPVVITVGRVFYSNVHGCPPYGETVAIVTGNAHPKFTDFYRMDIWRSQVTDIVKLVKKVLKQERVQIQFHDIAQFVYLEPEEHLIASVGGKGVQYLFTSVYSRDGTLLRNS